MFFKGICSADFLCDNTLLYSWSRSQVTPQQLTAPALRIMYSWISKYIKGKLGGVSAVSVARETQLTFKL